MPTTAVGVLSLYATALFTVWGGIQLRVLPNETIHFALERGLERGELAEGIPRLDADDPYANAAVIRRALSGVVPSDRAYRFFSVYLSGRRSDVLVGPEILAQLRRLKAISVEQPGFGKNGLAEVAALVLGRRLADGQHVEVTRLVVPPFRFSGNNVFLADSDLGALAPGEQLIGTYHTHPASDVAQGLISAVDLRFMHSARLDFHGRVGRLGSESADVDWLFDIVEPRDGEWNVYAHDRAVLRAMHQRFMRDEDAERAPEDLRVAGSASYLFTRYFEAR